MAGWEKGHRRVVRGSSVVAVGCSTRCSSLTLTAKEITMVGEKWAQWQGVDRTRVKGVHEGGERIECGGSGVQHSEQPSSVCCKRHFCGWAREGIGRVWEKEGEHSKSG